MRYGAPSAHEWSPLPGGLWYCRWCKSHIKSASKPDPEARQLMTDAEVELALSNVTGPGPSQAAMRQDEKEQSQTGEAPQ